MAVLLPVWVVSRQSSLGGVVAHMLLVGPIIFAALIVLMMLVSQRVDVKKSRMITKRETIVLLLLYSSVFLYGFFTVDNTNQLAIWSQFGDFARILGAVFFVLSAVLMLAALVVTIQAERASSRIARKS